MVNGLNKVDLKEFLDEKYQEYNNVDFIEQDPIQIPHLFHTYSQKKRILKLLVFLQVLYHGEIENPS